MSGCDDGSAMQDRIGYGHGYTLLRLGGTQADTGALQQAFAALRRAVRKCSTFPTSAPRDIYGCDLLLLRPDMHVAWRGNEAPHEPRKIGSAGDGALTFGAISPWCRRRSESPCR